MNNLGRFIVDDCVLTDFGSETVIEQVDTLDFYFNQGRTVKITQIWTFDLLEGNNIYIKCAAFSPSLYNAYQQNHKIDKLIEVGTCLKPTDASIECNYTSEYYNYEFKSLTFSRGKNEYVLILQPVSKFDDAND